MTAFYYICTLTTATMTRCQSVPWTFERQPHSIEAIRRLNQSELVRIMWQPLYGEYMRLHETDNFMVPRPRKCSEFHRLDVFGRRIIIDEYQHKILPDSPRAGGECLTLDPKATDIPSKLETAMLSSESESSAYDAVYPFAVKKSHTHLQTASCERDSECECDSNDECLTFPDADDSRSDGELFYDSSLRPATVRSLRNARSRRRDDIQYRLIHSTPRHRKENTINDYGVILFCSLLVLAMISIPIIVEVF